MGFHDRFFPTAVTLLLLHISDKMETQAFNPQHLAEMTLPSQIVYSFLKENKMQPEYIRLANLRAEGWTHKKGDGEFATQRKEADHSSKQMQQIFYKMMQDIGQEMQRDTGALRIAPATKDLPPQFLDLCMAPGGYSAVVMRYNPSVRSYGITLPEADGGHKLRFTKNCSIKQMDLTMLSTEFGVDSIRDSHPQREDFITQRPFEEISFDLVFCDGQVLRTHRRPEYRESIEAVRLTVAQLILALQRLREGGTLIMLCHKAENWQNITSFSLFSKFSRLQLWKPSRIHGKRSSFYMIARHVQTQSVHAKLAVESWKRTWYHATFGGEAGTGGKQLQPTPEEVQSVLDEFGDEFIRLAVPVWSIQARNLETWISKQRRQNCESA